MDSPFAGKKRSETQRPRQSFGAFCDCLYNRRPTAFRSSDSWTLVIAALGPRGGGSFRAVALVEDLVEDLVELLRAPEEPARDECERAGHHNLGCGAAAPVGPPPATATRSVTPSHGD